MPIYQAPVEDWLFLLNDFLRVQDQHSLPGYPELTRDTCADLLQAAARFHEEVLLPVGISGDAEGARLVDGRVLTPAGYKEAWQAYRDAGWLHLAVPQEIGGAGLPAIMGAAIGEMRITTAHSLAMYGSFCPSAARMLAALAPDWVKRHVVPRLVTGEWTATMCMTESHCGTDLRQLRTRATPQADGSWRLEGSKVFISGADHDLTENIIHIVLAKVADAGTGAAGGLGAVNVFMVSKHHIDPGTGALGARNAASVSSIEHKMGIEGSATCVLNFEGAQGWRIADSQAQGTAANMAPMFLLMNYARVSSSLSGIGYAEIACQNATAYARERLSGRAPAGPRHPGKPADPIIVHPDIRRLLMGSRSFAEGARATALRVALWQAQAEAGADEASKTVARDLMEIFTPLMKAFFTDRGFAAANDCLQVLGGHGYIHEYGLEQMVRNARIGQIYEGANGIQALDLVQRKLPAGDWRAARNFLAQVSAFCERQSGQATLGALVAPLQQACGHLAEVFAVLRQRSASAPEKNLAVAYDVLNACAVVALAWTWCEVAACLLQGQTALPEAARRRKLALARFWIERELPMVAAWRERIVVDQPAVLELEDDLV